MCGRYTLSTTPDELAAEFGLADVPDLPPRYNVAPGQLVAVVGAKPGGAGRGLVRMRWGFVPRWAVDPNKGPRPINARAETVATSPPFRASFRSRRCLIPADGFYEWAAAGGRKVARHFRVRSGRPFALAGVWDVWKGPGRDPIYTCAVLTVPANDLVRPVHDRMPAVLSPDRYDRWLDPATPVAEALALLVPYPAGEMEAVAVGPAVNAVANDGPECVAAVGTTSDTSLLRRFAYPIARPSRLSHD